MKDHIRFSLVRLRGDKGYGRFRLRRGRGRDAEPLCSAQRSEERLTQKRVRSRLRKHLGVCVCM